MGNTALSTARCVLCVLLSVRNDFVIQSWREVAIFFEIFYDQTYDELKKVFCIRGSNYWKEMKCKIEIH